MGQEKVSRTSLDDRLGDLNYQRLGLLGKGPIVDLYRARDFTLRRELALRVVRPDAFGDPELERIYWDGQRALASLAFPRLVNIVHLDPDARWSAVERMSRGLEHAPGRRVPDFGRTRTWLWQAMEALAYLHEQGLFHGAPRLTNVMLDEGGQAKLADAMGLRLDPRSGTLDDDGRALLSFRVGWRDPSGKTNPAAMTCPPELNNPGFGPVGAAVDQYILGFSFIELLCGPRFADHFPGLADAGDRDLGWGRWAASTKSLPALSDLVKNIPEDLATVLQRMVQKHVDARFGSVAQALAYLR